ncbi:pentatricopeptide repeat-containing protein At4g31070, mitochondrial [Cajanus cajan]|uniref:pentatricopeptide repeat-containing protein At4g31070, mitochondrial n=1 Tax=Cajanus cajan TaxID=3821 RepID=UPI00098D96B4|nr:pentatricopeptide repeat-containing protein At4g31070, mitochondrial [Cajanus cajan]
MSRINMRPQTDQAIHCNIKIGGHTLFLSPNLRNPLPCMALYTRRLLTTLAPTRSSPSNQIKTLLSNGLYHQTLQLFTELHLSGQYSISFVLPSVIKASSSAQCHAFGTQLHCIALKTGSHSESVVSNSIITMYAKFSDVESARKVFDTTLHRDPITWNSMINGYLQNGYLEEALETLKDVYLLGLVPKPELLASVVSKCGRKMGSRIGRQIHALVVVDHRIGQSVFLSTALVDFYFRCDDSLMALRVFDELEVKNEVSWTAMISGCIANQDYDEAFACFRAMQAEGVCPNRVTSIALLPACTEPGSVKYGKEIHSYAFRHGFESCPSFSSALINMYGQHGESMQLAELIFEGSRFRDVVLWSSIIGSYSRRGDSNKTFKLFNKMRTAETEPNYVTLLAVISACTNLSSLKQGCGLHGYIFKSGFSFSISVGNALINMYAKCGCLDGSSKIFLEMTNKDSVTWSSLINAYGLHGCGEQALQLFYEMNERRVKSDAITFLAVLSACNHAGLVSEGQRIFKQVNVDYKIPLTIEHYACLVDLLGRSGKLEDALEILRTMPMKPSARIWSSLVSACKLHGRLDIAEMLAPQLIRSEPNNAGNYTLLNMIYGEHGHWLDTEQVREEMTRKRLKKCYGFSRIEAGDENF